LRIVENAFDFQSDARRGNEMRLRLANLCPQNPLRPLLQAGGRHGALREEAVARAWTLARAARIEGRGG